MSGRISGEISRYFQVGILAGSYDFFFSFLKSYMSRVIGKFSDEILGRSFKGLLEKNP